MPDSEQSSSSVKAPHKPIAGYYSTETERTSFVRDMFDATGVDYDRIENLLAFGTGQWYRGQALKRAGLQSGMQVLDVGCGTGLVATQAIEIIGSSTLLTGLDPSLGMLQASVLFKQIALIGGKAEHIPFPDNSFDFLSMGYALRHVTDLEKVFREFHRVLKPEGRLCILEITRPETRLGSSLLKTYMRTIVPLLAKAISTTGQTSRLWKYYWDSIEACVPPQTIIQALESVGFSCVRRHRELKIFSEYQAAK
ncbi:methyltransferase domain-containing protein [Nitrosomonas sp. JL21]|uniref:class I SAM-dependent methyltransferase n=1 Tax=Nitrosomonas sp. JL21 TaxID=153949 RepID=UPI00136D65EF|nr:class I SAM-dependent methyltransferase [Nitrosomonas sp. JL21]MBL8498115.1 class I SAM-dependent methyltransferase [Nitrosomonas sp.]MXS76371.1 methyltransferase domain-containing protein [Nitrosomonas sp. JL21]